MRTPLTLRIGLKEVQPVITVEVRRIGRVPGYAIEDLRQEALEAFWLRRNKIDPNRSVPEQVTYAKRIVAHRLRDLKRKAFGRDSYPLDSRGNATEYAEFSDVRGGSDNDDPERALAAREIFRCIRAGLDADARATFIQLLEKGADACRGSRHAEVEEVRAEVARILEVLSLESEEKTMGTKKKPVEIDRKTLAVCHAISEAPEHSNEGYDRNESICYVQCAQKFTCLPESIKLGKYAGRLQDDPEVALFESGTIPIAKLIERATRRAALVNANSEIPADLLPEAWRSKMLEEQALASTDEDAAEETEEEVDDVTSEEIAESEEDEEEIEDEEEEDEEEDEEDSEEEEAESEEAVEEPAPAAPAKAKKNTAAKADKAQKTTTTTEETTMAKNSKTTKATKTKAPKKSATKAAEKPAKPAPAAKPPKAEKPAKAPKAARADLERCNNGTRTLPAARSISPEAMKVALTNVRLGTPFDLAVGMEVVRKQRDGSEIAIKFASDGFVFDGVTYPSLTAAGMNAFGRSIAPNDTFSIAKNKCTLIRGKGVPGGSYSRQGEAAPKAEKPKADKPAAAPKPATKKPAAPAKSAAKKAPAKKAEKAPPKKAAAPAKKTASKKAPPPPKSAAKAPKKAAAKKAPKKK